MDDKKLQFLTAVLGEDGASALLKATERSELLENALVPRTILAWIGSAPVFEGNVPGVDDVYASFTKSEHGFSGSVTMQDGLYTFANQSLFHVAATVAVSMGIDQEHVHPDLRAVDIERLGKSIDLLAKTRRATEELAKSFCIGCVSDKKDHVKKCSKYVDPGAESGDDEEDARDDDKNPDALEKAKEGPGMNAAPIAPSAPEAPTATAPQQPKSTPAMKPAKPKTVKPAQPPTLKLTLSEMSHRCPECGVGQFSAGGEFTGCVCFTDLAKSTQVVASDKVSITLKLNKGAWDAEAILTFLEAIGRG